MKSCFEVLRISDASNEERTDRVCCALGRDLLLQYLILHRVGLYILPGIYTNSITISFGEITFFKICANCLYTSYGDRDLVSAKRDARTTARLYIVQVAVYLPRALFWTERLFDSACTLFCISHHAPCWHT